MLPAEAAAAAEPSAATIFPAGWPQRLWFAWAGVFLPATGLAIAFSDLFKPDWQRPDTGAWIQLLLSGAGAAAFAPLILLAVVVNAAVFLRPGAWVAAGWSRAALATGFLLGLQYSILVPASVFIDGPWAEFPRQGNDWFLLALFLAAAYGITFAVPLVFQYLRRRLPPIPLILACGLGVLAVMVLCSFLLPHGPTETAAQRIGSGWLGLFIVGPLLTLFAFPVWTTDAIGRVLWSLGKPKAAALPYFLGALAAYVVAWRLAVARAVEAYDNLPKVDTNCFVATAAARGPRWLTGGFDGRAADGRIFPVSPQLQRFKLWEIALRELSPRWHRALRRVYDRFGPAVAAWGRTPGRAALLWLALRPGELLAALSLRLLAGPEIARRARRLYRR